MSSKRGRRRRQCGAKVRHDSAAAAAPAVAALRRQGEDVHSYPCRFCRGYHVGHVPRRVRQAIADRRRARGPR